MFSFKINFVLANNFIEVKSKKIELFLNRKIYLMSSNESSIIEDSKELTIFGEGYSTYREAAIDVLRFEQTLKLTSLKQHLGVSFNTDKHDDFIKNKLLKEVESQFLSSGLMFEGVLGHKIFESDTVFFDPEISQDVEKVKKEEFLSIFSEIYEIYEIYDTNFTLRAAIDILNSTLFEYSSKVKLILSMTAIEMLAENNLTRKSQELKLIESLVQQVENSDLDNNQKESLGNAVKNCRNLSIGYSCKKIIKENLNKERANEFYNLYNYRSQVVHSGKLKSQEISNSEDTASELFKYSNEAYILALDLIESLLKKELE